MSYRREETDYPAAWLFDRLASHFGRDQVFKDVDSIELGDDFVEVITTAVGSCEVLLALIGSRWLTITDEDGHRRLDNPGDFVRLEIEAALARNVRVIPILVGGARMPRAGELPASLAKLARRQALELSPSRFEADTRRLLRVLDRAIGEAQEEARQESERAARHREKTGQLQGQTQARRDAGESGPVAAEPQPGPPGPRRAGSAARLLDAGFMILVVSLGVIAMEALIRPSTAAVWPWWVIAAASVLGIAVVLGGVRQHAVPASVLLWVMTWHAAYALSVIGTIHSLGSTVIAVLSTECIAGAVVNFALCVWIVALLPRGIRYVNLFLAGCVGFLSAALVLGAIALHSGKAGVWTAVGASALAAALGAILTLIRAHQPRPASS